MNKERERESKREREREEREKREKREKRERKERVGEKKGERAVERSQGEGPRYSSQAWPMMFHTSFPLPTLHTSTLLNHYLLVNS